MPRNCAVSDTGCIDCPSIPAVPARPEQHFSEGHVGWVGANSVSLLNGHKRTVFQPVFGAQGAVVGLRPDRQWPREYGRIRHALYFYTVGPVSVFVVMEYGAMLTAPAQRLPEDTFEIRVANGVVRYLKNREVIHTSQRRADGFDVVTGCLYATGDRIA